LRNFGRGRPLNAPAAFDKIFSTLKRAKHSSIAS
jgi:hypothetical protein